MHGHAWPVWRGSLLCPQQTTMRLPRLRAVRAHCVVESAGWSRRAAPRCMVATCHTELQHGAASQRVATNAGIAQVWVRARARCGGRPVPFGSDQQIRCALRHITVRTRPPLRVKWRCVPVCACTGVRGVRFACACIRVHACGVDVRRVRAHAHAYARARVRVCVRVLVRVAVCLGVLSVVRACVCARQRRACMHACVCACVRPCVCLLAAPRRRASSLTGLARYRAAAG